MRQTKLGISTYSYPYAVGYPGFMPEQRATPMTLIDKAKRLGVDVLQIADNLPLEQYTPEELERISQYARARGIELEVGTRGIGTEHLTRYVEIAQALDSKLLRVVIDTKDDQPDVDEIVRRLGRILPLLEKRKIVLGIENHDRFKAEVFADLLRRFDSPWLGVVLDTVNSYACEENTQQVLDSLAQYTVNFHVKDYVIERIPNSMGLQVVGVPAGKGFLPVGQVLDRLKREAKQDFSTILELWMPQEKGVEETLHKEEQWVDESIAYLNSVLHC